MESVKKAEDLVTSKDATIAGFTWQADKKLDSANVYLENAEYFKKNYKTIKSIKDARADQKIFEFIIASCMLSTKSLKHLSTETQDEIITKLINFNKFNNPEYILNLTHRYFLTSGDSLGGTMRNVIGQTAQNKLTESIIARLDTLGKKPERILNRDSKTVAIKWDGRQIIFDKKPKFIGKSIDIIVLKGSSSKTGELEEPDDYVCCGELKGGIDPAGADEHWKTAKTALERISSSFTEIKKDVPKLIFLGAAIENAMSIEIFDLLQSNWLAGAANINYEDQFLELIDIIIS